MEKLELYIPGPSCSKLTMSLVNDSLKFTSSDTQICWNFLLKKNWVAFAVQKLLTFFSKKYQNIVCIESDKTVNEMTLNELVKLTMLWTTGPWILHLIKFWVDGVSPDEMDYWKTYHWYQHCKLMYWILLLAGLTHCRQNELPHTIYWKSPISILGRWGCKI